jgi:hypothetical protein
MTYKVQIDDVVRDATAEEAALIDAQRTELEAQAEAEVARQAAKDAVLAKLGLSADELAALLGA